MVNKCSSVALSKNIQNGHKIAYKDGSALVYQKGLSITIPYLNKKVTIIGDSFAYYPAKNETFGDIKKKFPKIPKGYLRGEATSRLPGNADSYNARENVAGYVELPSSNIFGTVKVKRK